MMNEIAEILRREDRFLVVSHINPDGDAIGSLLGMYLGLREMGKEVRALSAASVPDTYDFLPGKMSIVAKVEDVGFSPQWILALDTATVERISGDIKELRNRARLINVDHHPTNPAYGDLNFVESQATSTAEIVYGLLTAAGYRLSADVGKCLYTGLITDTGCFRFSGVTSRTLRIAAELLEPGLDSYDVTRHLFEEHPLARMKLEGIMLERLEIFLDGKLLVSTLHAEDFDRVGAAFSDAENMVNRLRESRGVEAGILITGVADGVFRVSFRSKGRLDVAAIAALLGGGGHRNAAGLRTTLPLQELKQKLVSAVEQALG
jgi:bifunctional oligoribonuclease and PAP phosphatase NrnA